MTTSQVTGRQIVWSKITANSITVTAGTETGAVANLQTAHDGSFLKIDEAAATPGTDLMIAFINVVTFAWVNVIAGYDGTTTHGLAIQLYNWTGAAYDTFDSLQTQSINVTTAGGYILSNHDFSVPDTTDYIGTGGDAGKVRVRLYHTMVGNASHDLWVDVVALYK